METKIDIERPLSPNWNRRLLTRLKRVIDVFGSFILLALLSPILLLLSAAVKLSSRGPVFYRWQVVGLSGRRFTGYKFRSMIENADDLKSQLQSQNEMRGPVFKLTRDPRVTKLGAWMRRYSLDELPQLYSVLKGDMSLVGPRPPLFDEFIRFNDYQMLKLAVKPGITCLWQVNGRNHVTDFDEWVKMDLEYIRSWNPWLDVRILALTLRAVVTGTGK